MAVDQQQLAASTNKGERLIVVWPTVLFLMVHCIAKWSKGKDREQFDESNGGGKKKKSSQVRF